MITIKIHGHKEAASIAGDLVRKALSEAGLRVTHWDEVTPMDRKPHMDAKRERAGVLLLEMRRGRT